MYVYLSTIDLLCFGIHTTIHGIHRDDIFELLKYVKSEPTSYCQRNMIFIEWNEIFPRRKCFIFFMLRLFKQKPSIFLQRKRQITVLHAKGAVQFKSRQGSPQRAQGNTKKEKRGCHFSSHPFLKSLTYHEQRRAVLIKTPDRFIQQSHGTTNGINHSPYRTSLRLHVVTSTMRTSRL